MGIIQCKWIQCNVGVCVCVIAYPAISNVKDYIQKCFEMNKCQDGPARFMSGWPGSVRFWFVHGTVRAVPNFGSDGSSPERVSSVSQSAQAAKDREVTGGRFSEVKVQMKGLRSYVSVVDIFLTTKFPTGRGGAQARADSPRQRQHSPGLLKDQCLLDKPKQLVLLLLLGQRC